jgi:hypothetical protein
MAQFIRVRDTFINLDRVQEVRTLESAGLHATVYYSNDEGDGTTFHGAAAEALIGFLTDLAPDVLAIHAGKLQRNEAAS